MSDRCACRVERDGNLLLHFACPEHLEQRIVEAGGIAAFEPSQEVSRQFRPNMIGTTRIGWNVIEGEHHA